MIVKHGNAYAVMTADGKKLLGVHKSKEDALNQLRAIEANKARRAGK